MKKNDPQMVALDYIASHESFHWHELVHFLRCQNAAPKNWLTVRAVLQKCKNMGLIEREPSVHIEKYIRSN